MIIVMIHFKVNGRNRHLPVWRTVSAFTWGDGRTEKELFPRPRFRAEIRPHNNLNTKGEVSYSTITLWSHVSPWMSDTGEYVGFYVSGKCFKWSSVSWRSDGVV